MAKHSKTILIEAPPDVVWDVMADVETWPSWTPSVRQAEPLTTDGLVVGARYRLRQPRLPAVVRTVDDVVPGRCFAWTSASPGVVSRAVHEVTEASGGVRAVLTFEQTGPLAGVSGLFYGRLIGRYVRAEAEGLRRFAESRPGRPRPPAGQ